MEAIVGRRVGPLGRIVAAVAFLAVAPHGAAQAGQAAGVGIADLAEVAQITTHRVSPDGAYVAFQVMKPSVALNRYRIGWYVVRTDGGTPPYRIADGGQARLPIFNTGRRSGSFLPGEIAWSPDAGWFAFVKVRDDQAQVWRADLKTGAVQQLTANPGDVERIRIGPDGRTILFAVGRTRAEIETADAREARLGYLEGANTFSVLEGPLWPPCSDGRARQRHNDTGFGVDRRCALTLWAVDPDTGRERLATAAESRFYHRAPDRSMTAVFLRGMLRDQQRFLEARSAGSDAVAWFANVDPARYPGFLPPRRLWAAGNGASVACRLGDCVTRYPLGLWWRDQTNTVVFLSRDGHNTSQTSLYQWRPGSDSVDVVIRTDDVLRACQQTGDQLVCLHESAISPARLVKVALSDGGQVPLADVNQDFRKLRFSKVEKIEADDGLGNDAHAHLVYPLTYRPGTSYPLVIVQYRSRGFLKGGVGDEQPIHVLAANDIAVLSTDAPRPGILATTQGHIELNVENYRYQVMRRGASRAIERMVGDLVDRGIVDPDRVAITGLSAGSRIMDVALLKNDYAAASASTTSMIGAPPNLSTRADRRRAQDILFGGSPFSETGFQNRKPHSIGLNADTIETPLLLQVADREYHLTLQTYHALLEAGKPVEMHVFPDEYHVKWQPAHREAVYRRNLQWFKFWLKGETADDPVDPAQYARWAALCAAHVDNLRAAANPANPATRAKAAGRPCTRVTAD